MVIPPEVRRISGWLLRTFPSLEECDAVSLTWEAVWLHGDNKLAAVVAKRRAIDLLRRTFGRDFDRAAPLLVDDWAAIPPIPQPPADDGRNWERCQTILASLDPREAQVLSELYLYNRTGIQVAAGLLREDGGRGVDPSRVSQLHKSALRHARDYTHT